MIGTPFHPTFSMPKAKTVNRSLSLGALALCWAALALFPAMLAAQEVNSPATVQSLGSGFSGPSGVVLDASGDVFVADCNNNEVKEIVAVNGVIPASPTIKILGIPLFLCPQGLALDTSGNLYLTAEGTSVIQVTAASGYTSYNSINQLPNASNVYDSPAGVAVDSKGDIFTTHYLNKMIEEVVAVNGSIPASPTIRSWGPNLNYIGGTSFQGPVGIAIDKSGNVFVADEMNAAVVEMVAVSGTLPAQPQIVQIGSGFYRPYGLAFDANQNLYVTETSQTYGGVIKELYASNGYKTVNLLSGGISSHIAVPEGIAVNAQGDIFFANSSNNQVVEFGLPAVNFGSVNVGSKSSTVTLNFIYTEVALGSISVLTNGASGLDFANAGTGTCTVGVGLYAYTACTVNVTFTPSAAGLRRGMVQLFDNYGDVLSSAYIEGTGIAPQVTFSPLTQSTLIGNLSAPTGIAIDGAGNIFVPNTAAGTVQEFTAASAYATSKSLGSGFASPAGIALDSAGNLFVADAGHSAIKEVLASGGYTTVNTLGSGFNTPAAVAIDPSGNLFIADSANNAIKEIPAADNYSTVLTLATVSAPLGIAVDSNDNLFVSTNANQVLELTASSSYATSTVLSSAFTGVQGIALDALDNVYVAEGGQSGVKEIVASGGYSTVLNLTTAIPNGAQAVTLDASGNIYATDHSSNQIFKLDAVDPPSLTFAATGVSQTAGPQTVTVTNSGNATLTFPVPTSGTNPSVSTEFSLANSSTCPSIASSGKAATLASAASCTLGIDFTPTASGSATGSLVLTDSNLNAASPSYTKQTLSLSGSGSVVSGTTTTLTSSLNPSLINQSVTFTATVAATTGSTVPVGTVQFSLNGTAAGSPVTLGSAGTAAYTTSTLALGSYNVTAAYTPTTGSAFSASTSNIVAQVVAAPTPTIAFSVPSHTYGDAAFTVSATSNSAATITYSVVSGPATLSGATVTLTGAGTVVLEASQAAYGSSYAAGSQTSTFTVNKATPTIALTTTASNPILAQTSVTLTATVSSRLTAPTGTVAFAQGSASLGTGTISNGVATLATTALAVGSDSITAVYSGDTNYLTITSSPLSETVASFVIAPAASASSTQTVAPGAAAVYSFSISPQGGSAFLAPITFSASGLPSGASASFSPATIAAGAGTTTVTLTIQVPQQTGALIKPSSKSSSGEMPLAALAFGLLLVPLARGFKRSTRHRLCLTILALLTLAGAGCLAGCTPGSNGASKTETYTVTVTGTSGALANSTTITLVVE